MSMQPPRPPTGSLMPPPPSSGYLSDPPPSGPMSMPPPAPLAVEAPPIYDRLFALVDHLGRVTLLSLRTFASTFKRPLEISSTIYQMESLGVRSMAIVAVTSLFIGMVMTIQFAFGLRRFGGIEYIPRVVVLSFARELAPTLTAVIVGGRIGSGMAAEVGAMNVTEQVDAIRALGADPAKKLVLPRVLAAIVVMPILSVFALILGCLGAIFICQFQFDIRPSFFLQSSLDSTQIGDFLSGILKTPFFGFIIAIVGCHFGLETRGGTEGVGSSTTRTVVVVSIAILVADLILTKLFMVLGVGL